MKKKTLVAARCFFFGNAHKLRHEVYFFSPSRYVLWCTYCWLARFAALHVVPKTTNDRYTPLFSKPFDWFVTSSENESDKNYTTDA